ncbi:MAG: hypothetical protein ACI32B_04995 [Erysipelotrichaceae bacterium]
MFYCIYIPLYIDEGGFFTLQEVKFYALYNNRKTIYLLLVILSISIIFQNRNNLKQWTKNHIKQIDIFLFLFLIITIISCRLSLSFKLTWLGSSGFFVGGYIISLAILSCLILSKAQMPLKPLLYLIYVANLFILIVTLFEGMGLDPLYTHQKLKVNDYYGFYATIGNTNWYSGYLSIITMVFLGFYLKEEEKIHSVLLLFFISLCIMDTLIIHAESTILAFFLAFLFLIPLMLNNKKYLSKLICCLIVLTICLAVFSFSSLYDSLISATNGFFHLISNKAFCFTVCVLLILLIIYLRRYNVGTKKLKPKLVVIVLISVLIATAIFMFILNPENFGNGRGEIWLYSLSRFKDYSLKYFLIGSGPENLNSIYSGYSFKYGAMLTTSHSEPIQVLLTMGILGFISYCMVWHIIFNGIKTNMKKEECLPHTLALIAYFGQSLVNSATVPNVLLLCVVTAIYIKFDLNAKE